MLQIFFAKNPFSKLQIHFRKYGDVCPINCDHFLFRFMPPDDPLGRHGPSLDSFLSKMPQIPEPKWQLCPYGRFCLIPFTALSASLVRSPGRLTWGSRERTKTRVLFRHSNLSYNQGEQMYTCLLHSSWREIPKWGNFPTHVDATHYFCLHCRHLPPICGEWWKKQWGNAPSVLIPALPHAILIPLVGDSCTCFSCFQCKIQMGNMCINLMQKCSGSLNFWSSQIFQQRWQQKHIKQVCTP